MCFYWHLSSTNVAIWNAINYYYCPPLLRVMQYSHGYTSVLDMNTAQDGAKIWDKIHHEGKCVKLLWSSSGAKTELI